MICKKCRTAVPEGVKTCPHCQAVLPGGGKSSIALIAFMALIVVTGAVYLFLSLSGRLDPEATPEDATPTPTEAHAAAPAPTPPAASPQPNLSQDETETPEPDPEQAALSAVAAAAEAYIHTTENVYISSNGYLYDYTHRRYVSTDTLVDAGLLPPGELSASQARLLYLLPKDIKGLDDGFTDGSWGLRVYAAEERPGGLALASSLGEYGFLYREAFNGVLSLYTTEHGDKTRPTATDPIYSELLSLATTYTYSEYGYLVHYMSADGKYALAVMRETGGDRDIRSFVYEKNENGYAIVLSELEEKPSPAAAINALLPDFNLSLLPPYPILPYVLEREDTLGYLVNNLKEYGVINQEDEALYLAGNESTAYVVFASGICFWFDIMPDGQSQAFPVEGFAGAEALQKSGNRENLCYILWQH